MGVTNFIFGGMCGYSEGNVRVVLKQPPPYRPPLSSGSMSMTSQSNTLLLTRPQLMPGMSLSDCICLNWRPSRRAEEDVPPGEPKRAGEEVDIVILRCGRGGGGVGVWSMEVALRWGVLCAVGWRVVGHREVGLGTRLFLGIRCRVGLQWREEERRKRVERRSKSRVPHTPMTESASRVRPVLPAAGCARSSPTTSHLFHL